MHLYLVFVIFISVLGMFQFGWNTGVINVPEKLITEFIGVSVGSTDSEYLSLLFSIAASSFILGGIVGSVIGGPMAEKFGRKSGLIYNQVFIGGGVILMGSSEAASSFAMLVIGRILIGIACGVFTGIVPMYIAEIAPVHLRGRLGTLNQLAVTCGILSSQVLGLDDLIGSSNWPLLLSLSFVPGIIQVLSLPFIVESPRFLILTKNSEDEGRSALSKLRQSDSIEEEFESIKNEGQENSNFSSLGIIGLLKTSKYWKPLLIAILMHLSQQITGINGIFFYSTKIFKSVELSLSDAQYSTLGVGCIMVAMTIVTIPLMDKAGRRALHLSGMLGMTISCILITIAFNLQDQDGNYTQGGSIFLVVSTLSFVVFFALGPGSIPWMITGELFTTEARAAAASLVTLVNWGASLVVTFVFPQLQNGLKIFTFVPFCIILVVLLVPLYFLLPETKNRSIQEIYSIMNRSKPSSIPNCVSKEQASYAQNVE